MKCKNLVLITGITCKLLIFLNLSTLHSQVLDSYGRDVSQRRRYLVIDSPSSPPQSAPQLPNIIDFAPYVTHSTGSWPEVVAIGDVNGDGLNDVVLGTSYYFDPENDYKIFVFAQDQQGDLNPPVKYDYGYGHIRAIDVGDLNGDTLQDVVIGFADSIGIYFQNEYGTLDPKVAYYSGVGVDGVKIGDLNNDGLMDIAVCHWNSDFIRIFLQKAYGIFDLSVTYAINQGGYDEIDVGDVTGDGLDDVIFMRGQLYVNANIAVFEQDTTGQLMSPVFYDLGDALANGVVVGDVNDDGRDDVVVTYGGNRPSSNIAVWLQDTLGILQDPPVSYPCYDIPEPIEIADLDLDGLNDVIVANGGWYAISVYQQNKTGTLNNYIIVEIPYASHYQPQGLAVGDINSDSKPDVILADYNHGLVVLRNTSHASVEERPEQMTSVARDFALYQNYPNPFLSTTTIKFTLFKQSQVNLKIYDTSGRLVQILVDEELQPEYHAVNWNPEDIKQGIYFYKMQADNYTEMKKMILLR